MQRLRSNPAKFAGLAAFLFFLLKGVAWLGVAAVAWWHTR